jgi:hypothetical protein
MAKASRMTKVWPFVNAYSYKSWRPIGLGKGYERWIAVFVQVIEPDFVFRSPDERNEFEVKEMAWFNLESYQPTEWISTQRTLEDKDRIVKVIEGQRDELMRAKGLRVLININSFLIRQLIAITFNMNTIWQQPSSAAPYFCSLNSCSA